MQSGNNRKHTAYPIIIPLDVRQRKHRDSNRCPSKHKGKESCAIRGLYLAERPKVRLLSAREVGREGGSSGKRTEDSANKSGLFGREGLKRGECFLETGPDTTVCQHRLSTDEPQGSVAFKESARGSDTVDKNEMANCQAVKGLFDREAGDGRVSVQSCGGQLGRAVEPRRNEGLSTRASVRWRWRGTRSGLGKAADGVRANSATAKRIPSGWVGDSLIFSVPTKVPNVPGICASRRDSPHPHMPRTRSEAVGSIFPLSRGSLVRPGDISVVEERDGRPYDQAHRGAGRERQCPSASRPVGLLPRCVVREERENDIRVRGAVEVDD